MRGFDIHKLRVDDGAPPLFLPDIGTFFNKDLALAEMLIRQLIEAGVDLIKGEILHDPEIALNDETTETYLAADGSRFEERYRSLIERKVLPLDSYARLFGLCRELKVGFVLSVYDVKGAEFSRDIGAAGLKISSSNIVHKPLIESVAKMELPIILDTGKSTLEEIARAIQWMEDAGATSIMIQHSPEAPPSALTNHNLRMLGTFRQAFNRPVGLSDHHYGEEMLYAAIALGAHSVEKGVIPDHLAREQDAFHALPVSKVKEVVSKCKNIHLALGEGMRYLRRDRLKYTSRMGLIAGRDLPIGQQLSLSEVKFAFPAKGIPVENWEIVEGWRLRRDMYGGEAIGWCDVEPTSA